MSDPNPPDTEIRGQRRSTMTNEDRYEPQKDVEDLAARLDRFALYIVHNEDEDYDTGYTYLTQEDWDYISDVRADHHGTYGNYEQS